MQFSFTIKTSPPRDFFGRHYGTGAKLISNIVGIACLCHTLGAHYLNVYFNL
jgi:hypothetical protein